jgi:predicted phosphodiesterase
MFKRMLQFVSDLHLDIHPLNSQSIPLNIGSKGIALLGDIGNPFKKSYSDLVLDCSERFENVFVIAGNHEYYNTFGMDATKQKIREICDKKPNIHFLDNKIYDLGDDVRLIGSTLWSYVEPRARPMVKYMMNDYNHIYKSVHPFGQEMQNIKVEDTCNMFEENVKFTEAELKEANKLGKKAIVLTHHAPLRKGTSHPKYEKDENREVNQAFASDLSRLFNNNETKPYAWLFGHTHYSTLFDFNGSIVASNCRGYPREETNFNPELHLLI